MIAEKQIFTKYERARILGARSLQIAMDAPLLLKISKEELERIKNDPLRISEIEFNSGVLPITVNRPLPKKAFSELKREKEEKLRDKKKEELEEKEEASIEEAGEIMELAKPEDEVEEVSEAKPEEAI